MRRLFYGKEHDLFRSPEDGRFVFSRIWADKSYSGNGATMAEIASVPVTRGHAAAAQGVAPASSSEIQSR